MSQWITRTRAFAITLLLAGTVAPLALEQAALAQEADTTTHPAKKPAGKKKKPKPAPVEPPAEVAPTPPPAPTPEPTPEPPPAPPPTDTAAAPTEAPASDTVPITETAEEAAKPYYFIGLRYRGTVVPKFMMNLFVNEGATVFSNSIGVEMDIRRSGFSMIPWIVYSSYNTGDMLFWQKNQPDSAQYYSDVKSSLQGIYAGADLLWSVKIAKHWEFEYGAGFGVGFLFGNIGSNWVYDSGASGPLVGSNGNHYTPCQAGDTFLGCNKTDHQNAPVAKVGGYTEPNWFNGGSVPTFFPHISIPELGIRYKPIKQLEARFHIGFSLTGFFFSLSADYGLEKAEKPAK